MFCPRNYDIVNVARLLALFCKQSFYEMDIFRENKKQIKKEEVTLSES